MDGIYPAWYLHRRELLQKHHRTGFISSDWYHRRMDQLDEALGDMGGADVSPIPDASTFEPIEEPLTMRDLL